MVKEYNVASRTTDLEVLKVVVETSGSFSCQTNLRGIEEYQLIHDDKIKSEITYIMKGNHEVYSITFPKNGI